MSSSNMSAFTKPLLQPCLKRCFPSSSPFLKPNKQNSKANKTELFPLPISPESKIEEEGKIIFEFLWLLILCNSILFINILIFPGLNLLFSLSLSKAFPQILC